jgi:flagellar basal body-associated protein FliL
MAEIHVEPKKQSSSSWIWIVVVVLLAAALIYYFMTRNKAAENNTATPANTTGKIDQQPRLHSLQIQSLAQFSNHIC